MISHPNILQFSLVILWDMNQQYTGAIPLEKTWAGSIINETSATSPPAGDPEVDLVGPEMNWMAHQWRCALRSEVDGCIYAVPCNASRWGSWEGLMKIKMKYLYLLVKCGCVFLLVCWVR